MRQWAFAAVVARMGTRALARTLDSEDLVERLDRLGVQVSAPLRRAHGQRAHACAHLRPRARGRRQIPRARLPVVANSFAIARHAATSQTCQGMLLLGGASELVQMLDCDMLPAAAERLLCKVAASIAPEPITALEMSHRDSETFPLALGLPTLDRLLHGGVPTHRCAAALVTHVVLMGRGAGRLRGSSAPPHA